MCSVTSLIEIDVKMAES